MKHIFSETLKRKYVILNSSKSRNKSAYACVYILLYHKFEIYQKYFSFRRIKRIRYLFIGYRRIIEIISNHFATVDTQPGYD